MFLLANLNRLGYRFDLVKQTGFSNDRPRECKFARAKSMIAVSIAQSGRNRMRLLLGLLPRLPAAERMG
jgi:hypothetical protein